MKKVKYIGPHDAVDLPLPTGGEVVVEHKKTTDVDDEHALQLVQQEANWEPVGWKKPAPDPEPDAAAEPASDQPDDSGVKE